MDYKKIKPHLMSEEEFRKIWNEEYCEKQIFTFDGIRVFFYSDMFDHCFYESSSRIRKDKSILSFNRLEKIYWIKDALLDPDTIKKKGWDSKNKNYDDTRRVTLVKGNYIVVILIFASKKARFVTAYEVNEKENLKKIMDSPDWE
ncbi:MAG: hypothetical protein EOM06_12825 [Sphingobacteriia bacterium]|nr:hypothetical protein [Sphingobacteriia bacterium]